MRELIEQARALGWRIVNAGKHLKWYPPAQLDGFVTTSKTPSDRRALLNMRADLRRVYRRANLAPPL